MTHPCLNPRRRGATCAVALVVLAVVARASDEPAPTRAPQAPALELAEVRTVFGRVDLDGDGRLDRREADHGGVAAASLARFDADADGRLDVEEYVVARAAQLAGTGRPAAPALAAESTRIQASWRTRGTLPAARGPSSRVLARRRPAQAAPFRVTPPSRPPREAPPGGDPSSGGLVGGGLPPGLGYSRLEQVARSEAGPSSASLEERARRAQELIQARLRGRSRRAAGELVVSSSAGRGSPPAARARAAGEAAGPPAAARAGKGARGAAQGAGPAAGRRPAGVPPRTERPER